MRTALHNATNQLYTVETYVTQFGPKLDSNGELRRRPVLCCLACEHPMHTIAEDGPIRAATWAHNPSKTPPFCPLKEKHGNRYEVLPPTRSDPEAGRILRARFFANWRRHWAHILEIIPMCEIFTLRGFIKHCDKTRFWEQVGLEEWFLPYIFLATCDFPPPKSAKGAVHRPYWVRCRFDSRVRNTEDLWIRVEADWGFIRAKYSAPARGAEPGPKHLIDVEPIKPDPYFLARVLEGGNTFQVNEMKEAFPGELA